MLKASWNATCRDLKLSHRHFVFCRLLFVWLLKPRKFRNVIHFNDAETTKHFDVLALFTRGIAVIRRGTQLPLAFQLHPAWTWQTRKDCLQPSAGKGAPVAMKSQTPPVLLFVDCRFLRESRWMRGRPLIISFCVMYRTLPHLW